MGAWTIPAKHDHRWLQGVETLSIGSAKVPRLPILADLVGATDAAELRGALARNRAVIDGYAATLADVGLPDMAATVRRAVEAAGRPGGLTSDLMNVATWLLAATFKTAGRATMTFAPWVCRTPSGGEDEPAAMAHCSTAECVDLSAGRNGVVALPQALLARMAHADAVIYERLVGAANAALARDGEAPCDTVLELARGSFAPRFSAPGDVKVLLKVDYKLDADGDLVVVDVNAGMIGAWFDDRLLADLAASRGELLAEDPVITRRMVDTICARFAAERGRAPASAAVVVLDSEMYDTWGDDDVEGLCGELRRRLPAGEQVPVIDAETLRQLAARLGAAWPSEPSDGVPVLGPASWVRLPELLVAYSFRVGLTLDSSADARLRAAGATLVDGRHHAVVAAKELADASVLGPALPAGVRLPESATLGAAHGASDAAALLGRAWTHAERRGWRVVAIKLDKHRKGSGGGDFPSAYLYPVTPLGRAIAERQFERVVARITETAGHACRLVAAQVATGGGYDCRDGARRDVELRAYAFPVLPAGRA